MGKNRSFRTSPRFPRHIQEAEADSALAAPSTESLRRAAGDWIAGLTAWDLYATLTYDPARTGYVVNHSADLRLPPSPWACHRHFARWADSCAFRTQSAVLAVGALEETKLGWPHFHVLISMGGCDSGAFRAVSEEWHKPHGFAKLARVGAPDAPTVAAYIAKYFTKDTTDILVRGELPSKVLPGQRWLTGLRVEKSR